MTTITPSRTSTQHRLGVDTRRQVRHWWETARAWPFDRHVTSASSDLRIHLLLAGSGVVAVILSLQQVIAYRALAELTPSRFLGPTAWVEGAPTRGQCWHAFASASCATSSARAGSPQ